MNRSPFIVIGGCFLVLFLLWIPGLKYPIVSDTAFYALLGESVWTKGFYMLFGESYAKHIPLHAIVSYPFVWVFGYTLGMKASTLLAGFGVLVATYLLLAKTMSRKIALGAIVAITFNHAFTLMTHLGSADLLFTTLFLLSLYFYVLAGENRKCYLGAFLFAGLASLTRYNGAPLFVLYLGHVFLCRRKDFSSFRFWISGAVGAGFFGLWFLRNFRVFGDPFYSDYTGDIPVTVSSFFTQMWSNFLYYGNPLHNLLPIFFLFALLGLWRHGKAHGFLVAAMLTAWVLTAFWTTQAMRFAFPGYPILMGFAVLGMVDCIMYMKRNVEYRMQNIGVVLAVSLVLLTHFGALCLYTYGECNAWFDRNIGWVEKDLGITSEGFYAWHVARQWVRENAPKGATVHLPDPANAATWEASVFREDIQLLSGCTDGAYRITQNPGSEDSVLFTTEEYPKTHIILERCT